MTGERLGSARSVTFSGLSAEFRQVSATTIVATAPSHHLDLVDVQVRTPAGTSSPSPASRFEYGTRPEVTGLTPSYAGMEGGQRVIVGGRAFTSVGGVQEVTFNGVPGIDLTIVSDRLLTVTAPPHAAGPVQVRARNVLGVSPNDRGAYFTYESPTVSVGRLVEPPAPDDALPNSADPREVECPEASTCIAVGSYRSAAGTLPLAEQRTGSGWSASTVPLPVDARRPFDAYLSLLSCPTSDFCAAIGAYDTQTQLNQPLLAVWDGTSWSTSTIAPPPRWGSIPNPRVLTCTATRACLAPFYTGIAITYVNDTWSITEPPRPAGATTHNVQDADCSETECVVVGYVAIDDDWREQPLIQTWRDGAWSFSTPTPPLGPDDVSGRLAAVSCPTDGRCVAVGNEREIAGHPANFALTQGVGRQWRLDDLHYPDQGQPTGYSVLYGLDCTAVGQCWAGGTYDSLFDVEDDPFPIRLMVLELRGGTWRAHELPMPNADPVFTNTLLQRVECFPNRGCIALGFYPLAGRRPRGVVGILGEHGVLSTSPPDLQVGTGPDAVHHQLGLLDVASDSNSTAVGLGGFKNASGDIRRMLVTDIPLDE